MKDVETWTLAAEVAGGARAERTKLSSGVAHVYFPVEGIKPGRKSVGLQAFETGPLCLITAQLLRQSPIQVSSQGFFCPSLSVLLGLLQ